MACISTWCSNHATYEQLNEELCHVKASENNNYARGCQRDLPQYLLKQWQACQVMGDSSRNHVLNNKHSCLIRVANLTLVSQHEPT